MAPAERIRVEVVWCPRPGVAERAELELAPGATLEQALQASGLPWQGLKVGIWSKVRELGTPLRNRDRVELYRPLTVDPKEARRQRYKRSKALPPAA